MYVPAGKREEEEACSADLIGFVQLFPEHTSDLTPFDQGEPPTPLLPLLDQGFIQDLGPQVLDMRNRNQNTNANTPGISMASFKFYLICDINQVCSPDR